MEAAKLNHLLEQLVNGKISVEAVVEKLKHLPYEDLGHTRVDHHRALRSGIAEVIYCESKTTGQILEIFGKLLDYQGKVLATRISAEKAGPILKKYPRAEYFSDARLLWYFREEKVQPKENAPLVVVATAGTSDQPVAEEAARTLEFLGQRVERTYDVGVAGIHRLFRQRDLLSRADVVISVAGMEGALTSVIAGLVEAPVIGVPTSVGYGAHFNGLAPLLTMLNSCASGVAVVNIDNGFGAAVLAHSIIQRIKKYQTKQD
ncbi:MAG: nickel pincer cofactor biosynthesis protein LarB [Calditrichia bacterium]